MKGKSQTAKSLSPVRALGLTTGLAVLIFGLMLSPLGEILKVEVGRTLQFRARHALKKDPKISDKLKVYAFDDSSVKYFENTDMPLRAWADLLKSLETNGPKVVFLPKVFRVPLGLKDADYFVKTVKNLPYKLVTGVFLQKQKIQNEPVWLPKWDGVKSLHGLPVEGLNAYGPHPRIATAFHFAGHGRYNNRETSSFAHQTVVRSGVDQVVPLAHLFAADKIEIDGPEVLIDGDALPLDSRGDLLVNFSHPEHYYVRAYGLHNLAKQIEAGEPGKFIPKDGIVVLLPRHSSGEVNFVASPFGPIPEGFVDVAVLNSLLEKNWLRPVGATALWVFLSLVLGAAAGYFLSALPFGIVLSTVSTSILAAGLLLFVYQGIEIPWLFTAGAFFVTASVIYLEKQRVREKGVQKLKTSLEGLISDKKLDEIVEGNLVNGMEPTSRIVTVMFVDVVGFYLIAEKQTPKEAFLKLREIVGLVTEIVHKHGGFVDKTLGDGLLCCFGHALGEQSNSNLDHADQALACAVEIQRVMLDRNLEAAQKDEAVYPVRIGIQTTSAYLGDLGTSRRIDLTLVGHGVNFAKRLETACDSFRIMIGPSTKDLLLGLDSLGVDLRRRDIQIKHYDQLVEAYECDPLPTRGQDEAFVSKAFRGQMGYDRRQTRFDVPENASITIQTNYGTGKLVNFSRGGYAVVLPKYVAKGATLDLGLSPESARLQETLRQWGLSSISVEVMWGHAGENNTFHHGLQIKNLNSQQKEMLLRELRKELSLSLPKSA